MLKKIFLLLLVLGYAGSGVSYADTLFSFKGDFDFYKKELFLKVDSFPEGGLSLKIVKNDENAYKASIDINHLNTDLFDISTVLEGFLEFTQDEKGEVQSLKGKFASSYTLINYKPSGDLSASLEFQKDILYINSFSSDHMFCKGSVGFSSPYKTDILFQLSGMDMNDFLAFFADTSKIVSNGKVDGDIQVSGSLKRLELSGELASYDAFVSELEYRSFHLNAKGVYPVINITGTNIIQPDGFTFNLVGMIDLSDKENFRKQIKELVKEPVVNGVGKDMEWTLKRVQFDDGGKTELKYLKRKDKTMDSLYNKETGMLGLEKKIEF